MMNVSKRALACAAVWFFALGAAGASAQVLDLNTVKCSEWLDSGKDNIILTMAWIDGYYQDEDASPIMDFDKMKTKAEKLAAYCATHKTIGLGTAAEKLFGK